MTDRECGLDCNMSIFKLASQLGMVFSRSEKHLFSLNWLSINQSMSWVVAELAGYPLLSATGHTRQNVHIQLE